MQDEDHHAKGGRARAENLSPDQRKTIAQRAANARWDKANEVPQAAYTGTLTLGSLDLPCAVLSDGTRVITETAFMRGMNMYRSGALSVRREVAEFGGAQVPLYLAFKNLTPYINRHLGDVHSLVLKYRTDRGSVAHGIRADLIPRICDVWLDAQRDDVLGPRQRQIAENAQLVIRALAHVGIIALVDEATGYQRDRASDALSKILEAFIAKELQPWVKTFPDEYYEQIFRLRGMVYPTETVKRPQYFGHLTNDIIYARLAPAVLEDLQRKTPRTPAGRLKQHLHRRLSPDLGHPKLREHMSSVITIMKLSDSYEDFKEKIERIHPRYNETLPLHFDEMADSQASTGM